MTGAAIGGVAAGPWAAAPEAALLAFLLVASLTLGALLALWVGVLLDEEWLAPLRPPLASMARAGGVALLLVLPVLVWIEALYPWATAPGQPDGPRAWWFSPGPFALRSLLVLAAGAALGWWATRPGRIGADGHGEAAPGGVVGGVGRVSAGIGLLVLVPLLAVMMQDWALSREEAPLGGLPGLALVLQGVAASVGVAALLVPAVLPEDRPHPPGLERLLLSLSLAMLWMGFVQFLTAWSVDIPVQANWYDRRFRGIWWWIGPALSLPALLGAVALSLVPEWSRRRLFAVSLLLVLHHAAQLLWVSRPGAPEPGAVPADLLALAAAASLLAAATWWAWRAMGRPMGRPVPEGGAGPEALEPEVRTPEARAEAGTPRRAAEPRGRRA